MHTITYEQKRFDQLYKDITQGGPIPYLGRLLQRAARSMPERTALMYEDTAITYAQLYYHATQFSRTLHDRGVKPRDRVLLLFENSPAYYIGYFGILQIGAVIAPLNNFLQEQELAHIIEDAKPVLIVVSSALRVHVEAATTKKNILLLTEHDMTLGKPVPHVMEHFEVIDLPPEEMTALLYTSGTTGFPKGVMLSSKNIITNLIQGITRFELSPDDRIFAVLPLFHSFAQNTCVWVPMLVGCTIILVPKIDRRAVIKGLEHKPTVFLGVPALYGLLCLMKTAPLGSVRIFVSGGDALPDKIRAGFALIYRRKLCNGYGLTEATPLVSGDVSEELTSAASIGRPLVGITIAIRDDAGNQLPQGTIGQLWIKGDNIMLGYYNAPDMTQSVLHNGWLSTGDLAYLDHKDRIVITGRYKDLIINKGCNIYPQEIENIILMHPNVIRAGVIGRQDLDQGEIPVAYVQTKEDDAFLADQLEKLCAKNLAAYKVPKVFICSTQALPTTATGKVDKKQLRKLDRA